MPAEMLASSCVSASSSSTMAAVAGSKGSSGNGHNSRKDRSCKGKRYLEMIGESKGGANSGCKRPKSNSVSAGGSNGETSESCSPSKSSSTAGNHSHKWVSGGFDLEERIAALPQLQDTHLVNALNNNRKNNNNTPNGKTLVGQNGSDVGPKLESPPHTSPSPTPVVNGDAKSGHQHYVNNNNGEKSRRAGSEEKLVMAGSPASSTSTVCSGDEASEDSSHVPHSPSSKTAMIRAASPETGSSPMDGKVPPSSVAGNKSPVVVPGREFLSASNFSISRSQGLDVGPCDGLTALAEVALSQAQAITTSSSS